MFQYFIFADRIFCVPSIQFNSFQHGNQKQNHTHTDKRKNFATEWRNSGKNMRVFRHTQQANRQKYETITGSRVAIDVRYVQRSQPIAFNDIYEYFSYLFPIAVGLGLRFWLRKHNHMPQCFSSRTYIAFDMVAKHYHSIHFQMQCEQAQDMNVINE